MNTIVDILKHVNSNRTLTSVDEHLNSIFSINVVEFLNLIEKASLLLLAKKIKKGDLVLVAVKEGVIFNVFDFAIAQIGAVSVPLYQNCSEQDLNFILKQCEPILIITDNFFLEKHEVVFSNFDLIILENDYLNSVLFDEQDYSPKAFLQLHDAKSSIKSNDLYTIIYSSGSTGVPKGIMLSHKNVLHNVKNLVNGLFIPNNENVISFLPLNHIFERVFIFVYLVQQINIVYLSSANSIVAACQKFNPFAINCTPLILNRIFDAFVKSSGLSNESVLKISENKLLDQQDFTSDAKTFDNDFKKYLGENLRHICCGSSKMPVDIARFYISSGIGVIEGYGMTEMAPMIAYSRLKFENKVGTVGRAFEETEIKISDQGEILVDGPGKFMGYHKNSDLTKKSLDGNFLKTGDQGFFDNEGFLVISSRISDQIKLSNGHFFNPLPLENRLLSIQDIQQAIIVNVGSSVSQLLLIVLSLNKSYLMSELIILKSKIEKMLLNEVSHKFLDLNIIFLTEPFTLENGMLTPTMKMKRFAIQIKYNYLYSLIERNATLTEYLFMLFKDEMEVEKLNNCKDEFEFHSLFKRNIPNPPSLTESIEFINLVKKLKPLNINIDKDFSTLLEGKNNKCFNTFI
jgi:long-chain acyl-CoA synthetase